ncbi:hypothetical protein FGG08_001035 [Glutinoglossum americanum]|uniref:Zn(2)-C6 fungal-type domain-containing protein n=1 Tax=Glutinoglossum americanum TaxID=1670608 RepID=A0A9P8IE61_9PEZI|nr:hypothetical protein FGG08_001035 [Glutinoglossum americanum]
MIPSVDILNTRVPRVLLAPGPDVDFGMFDAPYYDFRPSARQGKKVISTWIDNDESGTYDPESKKEVTSLPKRSRESPNEVDKVHGDSQPKKPRPNSWLRGRQQGESLVVSLDLKSDRGKAILGTYTDSPGSQRKRPGSPYKEPWGTPGAEVPSHLTPLTIRPYSARTRRPSGEFANLSSSLTISELSKTTSALDLSDSSLGHPEARSCRPCFELGIPCPLLEDGSTYPCSNCVEDDCDCELVLPPVKKRACENCRRSRVKCSYREGEDHSLPCGNCQHRGQKCVAGPKYGKERLPSGAARFKPTLERPFLACMPCRKEKKWCSLRAAEAEPPCNNCVRNGQKCGFERVEKYKDQVGRREIKGRRTRNSPETPITTPIPDASRKCGVRMTIKTAFAHPITFNHIPAKDGSVPCHWCDAAAFGIMGIGEVHAEVINWQDGQGYTEVSGGHVGRGAEPSRMCSLCTMDRMLICTCEDHIMHPLPGRDPEDFDSRAALRELLSDRGLQGVSRSLWCSICPSPAFFECCTPQELDLPSGEMGQAPATASGCGLLLCETCEPLLARKYKGDLQAMISDAESNSHNFPAGLRADVSFLSDDGELMRRMRANAMTVEA